MIHWWHSIFSLFFVVIALYASLVLDSIGRLPISIPLIDMALIAFAVFRLVRLFSYDVITRFVREWFVGRDPRTFLGTLGTLINCPWCTGLWFALIVTFFYALTSYAWFFIFILALGGIASLIQLFSNWLGWNAEHKKKQTEGF